MEEDMNEKDLEEKALEILGMQGKEEKAQKAQAQETQTQETHTQEAQEEDEPKISFFKRKKKKEKPFLDVDNVDWASLKEKPILNWKCIEDFDKVSDDDIFHNYRIKLSEEKRRRCREEFAKLREKYTKLFMEFYAEVNGLNKKRIIVAGGNYTFFFVLPQLLKWINRYFPLLPVEFKLFERTKIGELTSQDADIIITSENDDLRFDKREIEDAGYVRLRRKAKDKMFFAASKKLVEEAGSKENALKNYDIIATRFYSDENFRRDLSNRYALDIPGREDAEVRLAVDQYYMEYKFLRDGVGIGRVFSSMKLPKDIVILDKKPAEKFERFVIVKKDLNKVFHRIGRRAINILREKVEVDYYEKNND
jgi:DNA-binding transcriptional LysR family regulator